MVEVMTVYKTELRMVSLERQVCFAPRKIILGLILSGLIKRRFTGLLLCEV